MVFQPGQKGDGTAEAAMEQGRRETGAMWCRIFLAYAAWHAGEDSSYRLCITGTSTCTYHVCGAPELCASERTDSGCTIGIVRKLCLAWSPALLSRFATGIVATGKWISWMFWQCMTCCSMSQTYKPRIKELPSGRAQTQSV